MAKTPNKTTGSNSSRTRSSATRKSTTSSTSSQNRKETSRTGGTTRDRTEYQTGQTSRDRKNRSSSPYTSAGFNKTRSGEAQDKMSERSRSERRAEERRPQSEKPSSGGEMEWRDRDSRDTHSRDEAPLSKRRLRHTERHYGDSDGHNDDNYSDNDYSDEQDDERYTDSDFDDGEEDFDRDHHETLIDATLPIARTWSWVRARTCLLSERRRRDEAERAADLGFTDIVLHLNSMSSARSGGRFEMLGQDRRRSAEDIAVRIKETCDIYHELGIATHLMVFPAPQLTFTRGMCDAIEMVTSENAVRSVLLDAEDNWRHALRPDYDGAVSEMRERLVPMLGDKGIALGFTDIRVTDVGEQLVQICDYVAPQAYSTRARGPRQPGAMQQRLHASFAALDKPIVMLVAAWNIRRKRGMSITETIEYTFDAVQDLSDPPVAEIAYWSIPAALSTSARSRGRPPLNTPAESREIRRCLRALNRNLADERQANHRKAMD